MPTTGVYEQCSLRSRVPFGGLCWGMGGHQPVWSMAASESHGI